MKVEKNMILDNFLTPILLTGWGYVFSSTTLQLANGGAELNMLEQLVSLGIGGIIAALVLWWKRQDDKEHKEQMQKMNDKHEERIEELMTKGEKREERMISALEAATKAVSDMSIVVDRVSSRSDLAEKIDNLAKSLEGRNATSE